MTVARSSFALQPHGLHIKHLNVEINIVKCEQFSTVPIYGLYALEEIEYLSIAILICQLKSDCTKKHAFPFLTETSTVPPTCCIRAEFIHQPSSKYR